MSEIEKQPDTNEPKREKVRVVSLQYVDDFPDHPFQVREDEDIEKLIESIRNNGVLNPIIVRKKEDERYEIISGHRRKYACKKLGMDLIPMIVRDISRDEAVIAMVDSNLQREVILPSEKARAYKMKMDAKSMMAKQELTSLLLSDKNADIILVDPEREYTALIEAFGGETVVVSATSENHINALEMNRDYADGANPVTLKSEFILSLCEQVMNGGLGAKEKSVIDRCTAIVYRNYMLEGCIGEAPTLRDFRKVLLEQSEPEAQDIALAIELFTDGSLNTFAKPTNVNTRSRFICYDIHELGKQLMPIGMLVVLDSILNRITENKAKGRKTYIFLDEIYLLFQHEYSANFLFTLWKRVRKYGAYITGITQNCEDLLQSHTARTMLANSELVVMFNQAATDREPLAELMGISDLQMSYITNVEAGHGLVKVGGALVPFVNHLPRDTELYRLCTTKPGE